MTLHKNTRSDRPVFSSLLVGILALAGFQHAALADHGNSENAPGKFAKMTRYEMANQCWAIISNANQAYLAAEGDGYAANAMKEGAAAFYLKPTALGKYMLYNADRALLTAEGNRTGLASLDDASDAAEWTVLAVGDDTEYPPTPAYHVEPTPEQVRAYLEFKDPDTKSRDFTIAPTARPGEQLAVDGGGALVVSTAGNNPGFRFVPSAGCANFPEAESNFSGVPFRGALEDGSVLGHTDAHVHISATEFLGGIQHGFPYHKFGVTHALSDCRETHGEHGLKDAMGGLFSMDPDGHATSGFPEFEEWPARDMLTHEAIYWKWLERSWAAGLRVIVNDLVDNQTLCELTRELNGDPTYDCNSMNNAGRQAGTMYGMMDYIDAQYGGRGKGFFRIVHDSGRAREVIADGKIAVILGIEISNLFDCTVNYNPLRTERPFEETGSGGRENSYGCTRESLVVQMDRAWGWGVRQIITIHEFDNAFGGNGIFDGLILNLGNRENSGLIPSDDMARAFNFLSAGGDPGQVASLLGGSNSLEQPTGEWWTTYDCPVEDETEGFSGYLWSKTGGSSQSWLSAPFCQPMGQDGRYGGPTPCYPKGPVTDGFESSGFRFSDYPPFSEMPGAEGRARQCNARWMTPIGLFAYKKIMERGFIFDWDHLEMGMKTQLLELAEAQEIPYPLVSTHGTFGGTTIEQAARVLQAGGVLYPSNGSSRGFREDMEETYGIYLGVIADMTADDKPLFGFGYGTDTNGLSGQTGPRSNIEAGKEIRYPYVLFEGEGWDKLPAFKAVEGGPVVFDQPSSSDAEGKVARTWHQDKDGNAHHGMISGFVQEIALEGHPDQLQHLFNSAEAYLRMWDTTEKSSARIRSAGGAAEPGGILRPAPPIGVFAR